MLNGQWIRISAIDSYGELTSGSYYGAGYYVLAPSAYQTHGAKYLGMYQIPSTGMFGNVRIVVSTNLGGSNSYSFVDLFIYNTQGSGGVCAKVLHNAVYGYQLIKRIRIGKSSATTQDLTPNPPSAPPTPPSFPNLFDPATYLDIMLTNLVPSDQVVHLSFYSFGNGNIRFCQPISVGPFDPVNTGSSYSSNILDFSPNVGDYWTSRNTSYSDMIVSGRRLRVDETTNGNQDGRRPYQTLEVSGSVGATSYYVNNIPGLSASYLAYDPVGFAWKQLNFDGILTSVQAGYDPTGGGGVVPGASYNISTSYASSSTHADTASYYGGVIPYLSNPGVPKAWGTIFGSASMDNKTGTYPNDHTMYNPIVLRGYNIADVKNLGVTTVPCRDTTFSGYGSRWCWGITFTNPLPNADYMVQCGNGGEQAQEYLSTTVFPVQSQTVNGFTMSMNLYNANFDGFHHNSTSECDWFTFVVYSNP